MFGRVTTPSVKVSDGDTQPEQTALDARLAVKVRQLHLAKEEESKRRKRSLRREVLRALYPGEK